MNRALGVAMAERVGTAEELGLQAGDIIHTTAYFGGFDEHERREIHLVLRGPCADHGGSMRVLTLWSDPMADRHDPNRIGREFMFHARFRFIKRILPADGVRELARQFADPEFVNRLNFALKRLA